LCSAVECHCFFDTNGKFVDQAFLTAIADPIFCSRSTLDISNCLAERKHVLHRYHGYVVGSQREIDFRYQPCRRPWSIGKKREFSYIQESSLR